MILFIIIGIIILISSLFIEYKILSPKIKQTQQLDKTLIDQNLQNQIKLSKLTKQKDILSEQISSLNNQYTDIQKKHQESLDLLKQAEESAQNASKQYLSAYIAKADTEIADIQKKYNAAKQEYEQDYQNLMSDMALSYTEKAKDLEQIIIDLNKKVIKLRSQIDAAVEASKREAEIAAKADFYKLNLSEEDLEEIKQIKTIIPYLRDPDPVNKVIWKTYYEKPFTDLTGRVIGSESCCGIYKLTNLTNKMCYIGQSADIKDRWRQHIKAGLGIGGSNNKLYTAMKKYGVENFSFEVIEKCSREELNEKEKYWISYFHGEDYGMNMTVGNR